VLSNRRRHLGPRLTPNLEVQLSKTPSECLTDCSIWLKLVTEVRFSTDLSLPCAAKLTNHGSEATPKSRKAPWVSDAALRG
jgi:hypothetical protein